MKQLTPSQDRKTISDSHAKTIEEARASLKDVETDFQNLENLRQGYESSSREKTSERLESVNQRWGQLNANLESANAELRKDIEKKAVTTGNLAKVEAAAKEMEVRFLLLFDSLVQSNIQKSQTTHSLFQFL